MDISKLAAILHPLERKVLPLLGKHSAFEDLVKESGMQEVEVMRALQWLQNKNIVKLDVKRLEIVSLSENGKIYKEKGLPELRFLQSIEGEMSIDAVLKKAELSKQEMNACLGVLKGKAAIEIKKGPKGLDVVRTPAGDKMLEKDSLETQFLQKDFPLDLSTLEPQFKLALDNLKKRKDMVQVDFVKKVKAKITDIGRSVLKEGVSDEKVIDRLTPGMLKNGSWKGKKFRRYDVEINVPQIYGGKRHFVNQATDYAKKIWLDMGFREMTGPLLDTSFWNFDALFTAQDHPVREMQDTFFVKEPANGKLPDKKLVSNVKDAHEKGTKGSTGWGGNWTEKEAQRNVLRTHTTVLSAKELSKLKKEDLPVKVFALGRCFRNETLDWSHLFEFNQTEGIVIDPKANFRHLLGYLKQFFRLMGFEKARFRPAHFPYTEPSVEIDVYHPVHEKWVELGGAGIFRPEVVVPLLGIDVPVLAWGPGFDRILMEYYKITDIRDLYKNDLKQIREMKFWMK